MLLTSATEHDTALPVFVASQISLLPVTETSNAVSPTSGIFVVIGLNAANEVNESNILNLGKWFELSGVGEIDQGTSYFKKPFKRFYGEYKINLLKEFKINLNRLT